MKPAHTPIDNMPFDRPASLPPAAMPAVQRCVSHPHVKTDPAVLGGSPFVAGSRVPVRRLWSWHRGGASVETLIKRYPNLGPAKVLDALAFAFDNTTLIEDDLAQESMRIQKESAGG